MYGLGAYFAIREAVKAFNQDNLPKFDARFTPKGFDESVWQALIKID